MKSSLSIIFTISFTFLLFLFSYSIVPPGEAPTVATRPLVLAEPIAGTNITQLINNITLPTRVCIQNCYQLPQDLTDICQDIVQTIYPCKAYKLVVDRLCLNTCHSINGKNCSLANAICEHAPECPCQNMFRHICSTYDEDMMPMFSCPNEEQEYQEHKRRFFLQSQAIRRSVNRGLMSAKVSFGFGFNFLQEGLTDNISFF